MIFAQKSLKCCLVLAAVFFTVITQAQTYSFASYNLRFDNKNDIGNLWQDRKAYVASLIRFHDFDIFGTQEAQPHQLADIIKALPDYARYGKGRDDGGDQGEHSAIFYKKDKFHLLASGDFWLSETPDKPGLGWDATCCNRICSWVYVQDKQTKKKFYFFNVHFDHQGKVARVESSKLMLKKIGTIAKNAPAVLTGDFNADRASEPYQLLAGSTILRDSYKDVKFPYENNSSFNGFKKDFTTTAIIDHIFLTKEWQARKWGVLTDTYFGKFPSDHFPVVISVQLK
ncbi:endonuclease/exonuclease/phosphatase family protein [Niabella insulamsoli]|uniref:endonuclease/exonuclease/phosphatase family protein n=1 Tax=Niabella insulamsoli TaxID=3144874 RepID=UPI0031FE3CB0